MSHLVVCYTLCICRRIHDINQLRNIVGCAITVLALLSAVLSRYRRSGVIHCLADHLRHAVSGPPHRETTPLKVESAPASLRLRSTLGQWRSARSASASPTSGHWLSFPLSRVWSPGPPPDHLWIGPVIVWQYNCCYGHLFPSLEGEPGKEVMSLMYTKLCGLQHSHGLHIYVCDIPITLLWLNV